MEKCKRCKKRVYFVWRASDDLWSIVSEKRDGSGILCPKCFELLARKKGIPLYWECSVAKFPKEVW